MAMVKKEINPFAVVPQNGEVVPFHGKELVHKTDKRSVSKRENKIAEEYEAQKLVIDLTGRKTALGMRKIDEVNQEAMLSFEQTGRYIFSLKEESHPKGLQPLVDQFATELIKLHGVSLMESSDAAASAIVTEIGRTLYAGPEPLPSRWQRLFGNR